MNLFMAIFKPPPADIIVSEQLYEAQRKLVEHEAAAEHHAALAEMYRRRVVRLGGNEGLVAETAAIELKSGRRFRG
ncbi:MAG: hypothetical protein RLZZ03_361 [Pseudomonadota bacterium]|jgi:hypothetical protein